MQPSVSMLAQPQNLQNGRSEAQIAQSINERKASPKKARLSLDPWM
jgi:hypothetical protein